SKAPGSAGGYLLPALEKASLEEPGSEFIERWANLLASAATDPGDDIQTCGSILAELGHNEAELLNKIQEKLVRAQLWPDNLEKRQTKNLEYLKEIYSKAKGVMLEVPDDQETDSERLRQLSGLTRISHTTNCLGRTKFVLMVARRWPRGIVAPMALG